MLSSLSGLSPLPARGRPPQRSEPPPPEWPEDGPPEVPDGHLGRKLLAGAALGLTGMGLLATAGGYVAAHAPICQTQQVVGWENGGPCVSLEVAVNGATAWRYTKAPFNLSDALDSWQTGHHRVIPAEAEAPRLGQSDQLKVVSWNLHHGLSQDSTGARPQLDTMIEQLQAENADVLLLQEVNPSDAERLADELDMQGYFATSTPVQGNLILLRPDIEVHGESVTFTTGQRPAERWGTLKDWVTGRGGQNEPRTLQILNVTMPDGREGLIWNTHHLTGTYTDEQRQEAAEVALREIHRQLRPDQLHIGGGDLNANDASSPLIRGLNQLPGVTGHQRNIDWIYASDSTHARFSGGAVDERGVMVSDHVLVRAELEL